MTGFMNVDPAAAALSGVTEMVISGEMRKGQHCGRVGGAHRNKADGADLRRRRLHRHSELCGCGLPRCGADTCRATDCLRGRAKPLRDQLRAARLMSATSVDNIF